MNRINGFTYARQSLHRTMGFVPYETLGISSPEGSSPYGFTITPIGIAISFWRLPLKGMRSVVTLSNARSELYSSKDYVLYSKC
mmetsp:Transcript_46099/g.33892  ORF Transcript_46099/g.33892 Transcript_46099/m.33892 type:complete len:84 (-) Transcript_46099:301-552(-)